MSGHLPEQEREEFEEHYFSCEQCAGAVVALQAARAAALEPSNSLEQRRRSNPWLWPSMAIAAAIVIALVVGSRAMRQPPAARVQTPSPAARGGSPRSPALTELARMEPPRYAPPTLRDAATTEEKRFRAAMKPYQAGDYATAAGALRAVSAADPRDFNARFFLGATYLLTGDTAQGIDELNRVVGAGDASPYVEEARFLLAKAYLREGEVTAARTELQAVAHMRGDFRANAETLLRELDQR